MAMTLRLSDKEDKELAEIADSLGISKNTAAKVAIQAFIDQQSQRLQVREALAMLTKRDAKLLDRLSDD
jgi:predicted transcriptional regulator